MQEFTSRQYLLIASAPHLARQRQTEEEAEDALVVFKVQRVRQLSSFIFPFIDFRTIVTSRANTQTFRHISNQVISVISSSGLSLFFPKIIRSSRNLTFDIRHSRVFPQHYMASWTGSLPNKDRFRTRRWNWQNPLHTDFVWPHPHDHLEQSRTGDKHQSFSRLKI